MEKIDTVVKGGKVVLHDGILEAGVAIDKGKVVSLAPDAYLPEAKEVIDAGGNYILPGFIDPHGHLQRAYYTMEENIKTETQHAAVGGITTMIPMTFLRGEGKRPFSDVFEQSRPIVEDVSTIDMGFTFMVATKEQVEEFPKCVREFGVTSFKMFMAYSGAEAAFFGVEKIDDGLIINAMETARDIGYPCLPTIHTENMDIVYWHKERLMKEGRKDLAAWSEARPPFAEEETLRRAIYFAEITKAPIYIVHISIGNGVGLVAEAVGRGLKVIGETCPHYLIFTQDDDALIGCLGKLNPPLRSSKDGETLWQGIRDGVINTIGSDHSTIMPTENKKGKDGDIWSAIPGFPGTGFILPSMLSEGVNKGKITLEKLVEVCSYNVAKAFGLFPQKGTLRPGSDADLVIIDLDKTQVVSPELVHTAAGYTLFDGRELTGWPVLTMLRGKVIMRDGELTVKPGYGKYVPRYA